MMQAPKKQRLKTHLETKEDISLMVIFELIYADTSFLSILHRDLKQEFNREKISKASKFRKLWYVYFLEQFS